MSPAINSRVWLVTGTSSGMGRHLVEEILASGERVVATTRKASGMTSLSEAHSPQNLLVVELDISSIDQVKAVFQQAKSHFGRLDVVVNNAGYGLRGEVEAITDEEAKYQMEVNFWGPVRISREAVRYFRENNSPDIGGRILNISSGGGFSGNPTLAFYSASKFALEGFSESLSKELPSEWNIHITIIEPGGIRTEWNKGNMVKATPHPAYAGPNTPSTKFAPLFEVEYPGDPGKAAQIMIIVSKVDDPPLRLPIGADALHVIRFKCASVVHDAEKWEALSLSTTADDADQSFFKKLGPATLRK